jgi:hypothetical protein
MYAVSCAREPSRQIRIDVIAHDADARSLALAR